MRGGANGDERMLDSNGRRRGKPRRRRRFQPPQLNSFGAGEEKGAADLAAVLDLKGSAPGDVNLAAGASSSTAERAREEGEERGR